MYIFDHIQKFILVPMVVTTVTSGCMRGWQRPGVGQCGTPETETGENSAGSHSVAGPGLSSLVKCLIITLMVHPAPGQRLVSTHLS